MSWYLIHTKPRQERRALHNLESQGYTCFLPMLPVEKLRRGAIVRAEEPLFARYLFIRLDAGQTSWAPIRSTKGVHRLVMFGTEPARVAESLLESLQVQQNRLHAQPQRLFTPGERVVVMEGPFAGLEAIYRMYDGERRAMVLIDFLSKPTPLHISPASLRKI